MKIFHVLLCSAALVVGSAAGSVVVAGSAAADAPPVSVVPSTGLAGGETVHVAASGITPSASVNVVQCDIFNGDPSRDCNPRTTTMADTRGSVSVNVTLGDPVYRNQEVGDPKPIYCRADICHIFLSWTDPSDVQQVLTSNALKFSGSPATIAVRPNSDLPRSRRVAVTGTAFGAKGHGVRIFEELCFNGASAGSGCDEDTLPVVRTNVRSDGTFGVHYRAKRFLPDGTDCADPGPISYCEMTAVILKTNGTPDFSFGDPTYGQPAALLTFRTQ